MKTSTKKALIIIVILVMLPLSMFCTWQIAADVYRGITLDSPLMFAASVGDDAAVVQLLNKGADVNTQPADLYYTPLMWAINNGYPSTAKILLSHGADVNATNYHGESPLSLAKRNPKMLALVQSYAKLPKQNNPAVSIP